MSVLNCYTVNLWLLARWNIQCVFVISINVSSIVICMQAFQISVKFDNDVIFIELDIWEFKLWKLRIIQIIESIESLSVSKDSINLVYI